VASGIQEGANTILTSTSPGVTVTITRESPGHWKLHATGLGNACPLPQLIGQGGPIGMSYGGGGCGGGTVETFVETAGFVEHNWGFLLVGTDPPAATPTHALPHSRHHGHH
jgi:hypothetical protein